MSEAQAVLDFDGFTFSKAHDGERLSGQLSRVFTLMADGKWRTLREIQAVVGGSETGVAARTRDLRKTRFGSHNVERRRVGDPKRGVFEYRLVVNT